MSDEFLIPNFSTDGYSLKDARTKNENGLCAFENCNNFPDSEELYMGFKVCKKCHKPIQDGIKSDLLQEEKEVWRRLFKICDITTEEVTK